MFLQNTPPVFDQRALVRQRSPEWRSMMQWAQAKLMTARQGSPDDWELPFFLGKMAFKLALVSRASSNLPKLSPRVNRLLPLH